MSTRHLLDPELASLPEVMPAFSFDEGTLKTVRAQVEEHLPPDSQGQVAASIRSAPGRDGGPDVPVHVYDPPSADRRRPALLYFHGGGMVMGTAGMARVTLAPLLQETGAVGISVEYRLAPDTPFPGPQEDAYAALEWLVANADALGVDPARIIVMGESAGGGIAASLAIMARDRGQYALAGQALSMPMLDYRTGSAQSVWDNPTSGEFVWNRAANQFGWTSLRGSYDLNDARRAWFSPALADDLTGLPPAYMSVGALDLFVDEDMDYARRLAGAGIPVDFTLFSGAPHAFGAIPDTALAKRSQAELIAGLKRLIARSAPAAATASKAS
ncbi:alpha/beta hydrolase [Sphingomonas sp. PL-96]|uniref:alpha/beta hydrolase n=1 Tax=Sphingomonas sp. PL-96 TaxID=2887201 RepID=UPI001E63E5B8|nr:alpha/beta hydrolase [Sphingomonas sp. PL-96]MCC2978033.1 alpha/beta hydrolase [Sphingomonas sp. PL-96]